MLKSKVALAGRDPEEVLRSFARQHTGNATVNTEDGVKLLFEHSWIHLRKSNTEPIVRIIAEAPTFGEAEELTRRFSQLLLSTEDES
jgi:phosphomannomutase